MANTHEPTPADSAGKPAQRVVVSHLKDATFDRGLREFFEYRDLGVAQATAGAYSVHVIRALDGHESSGVPHLHQLDFQFVYVLQGWVEFEYEQTGVVRLERGDSVYQPPGVRHREIRHSADLEMLEVVAPASFHTATLEKI
ncbi:cupin domain-containing protein [Advenella mimigardefordensis]|uniref:Cupin 2 domain-containing protein n=1 Tax=Advenella mimigardefordensis (strain DSM 17166 / LMG 22922 / DPN7) TaxID=1247726 RepID=W0PH96_ADVMD|nr:cupin domain-containing protein [Advenella mimigardefordensis]AHG64815.1 cupin 2 domain-containing protein [Advenella mimigardefordensis DPN7]